MGVAGGGDNLDRRPAPPYGASELQPVHRAWHLYIGEITLLLPQLKNLRSEIV